MKIIKTALLTALLAIIILLPGCGIIGGEEEQLEETGEEIPEEIEKIESLSLKTMQEADLIVLLKNEEDENEGEEDEDKDEGEGEEGEETENEENGENKQEEELTFEKTILGEVLRREMEEGENMDENEDENGELAQDEEEAWDNIKLNVTEIHEQWSDLEPQLKEEEIPEEQVNTFEDTLKELTTQVTAQDSFATIISSNKLTAYLAEFMVPFAEEPVSEANNLKFYVRKVVLNAVADKYEEAGESIEYISERKQKVTEVLEEEQEKEMAEQLEFSVENLEGALEREDADLVKLSAALVMEDLVEILEELKEQEEEEEEDRDLI